MFLSKKHKHNFLKPQFLPASFFTSILSVLFFCTTTTVFAASAPPYLTLSISTPTVNFQFNQAENAASTFKEDMAVVQYNTDNKTGFTAYVSSIDEDTSLNHVDSSVTQKITSITTPGGAATFGSKNWGYLANQTTASTTSFNPIPKASQPDQALNISLPEGAKFFLHFGVKTGSDLPAGTYSKKILVTAITNYVPTSATFLTGPVVNGIIRSVNTGHDVEFFKKAAATPPVGVHTETVSTADSDLPIYLWYDQAQKTIFWWSNADTVYANEDSNYMLANINDNSTLVQLIDMRGINTSRMKNAHHMFWTKEGLTKHIDLSEFDTSNLEDAGYMFSTPYETVSTAQIDPIDFSHFNTSKVKIMTGMFYWTLMSPENATLDISNFDTRSLTSALGMFNYTKAKTIYASDQFTVNNVAPHPHEMFITNTNLVGGNGTQYVWPNNSSQYAHIDAPGNPGYFTRKP